MFAIDNIPHFAITACDVVALSLVVDILPPDATFFMVRKLVGPTTGLQAVEQFQTHVGI